MNKQITSLLIKICILVGAFFLGLAARTHAQTPSGSGNPADTTHHRFGMHRNFGMRRDSLHRFDGAQRNYGMRGGQGTHQGWGNRGSYAFHRGFNGHRGHREFVHYTPEQHKQVMAISKEYHQKAADLFKQDNITLKQYKAGLVALQKDKKAKMEALLTPLQKDELALRRKSRTDNAQLMADHRLERLKQSLSLSDDQVTKLKAGQENLRTQVQAIHENENLLPQEKREQLKTLMATRNDNLKSVLTPDQYSKFQQMMSHRRPGGFGPRGGFHGGGSRDGDMHEAI
jgi:Spy/CpxP family protein refolding chaperone